MENDKVRIWKGLLWTIFFVQLLLEGDCRGKAHKPKQGKSISHTAPKGGNSTSDPAAGVRVDATNKMVVLDNGIVQVTFQVPEGYITGIRYGGLDNVLDGTHRVSDRGYWDIASFSNLGSDGSPKAGLTGASFKIICQTPDKAEISFICPKTSTLPLQADLRYVMLRDRSGFYAYAIFEHQKGFPQMGVDYVRTVYKPSQKFHYMAVSDKLQREMPNMHDRDTGKPLDYKEAVLLTNPTNPKFKGEVDDKYQYSIEGKDNKLHGWVSTDPAIGVWLITPTDEFRMGGPHKQCLTSHAGPIMLSIFQTTHYAGNEMVMRLENGEPWKKVFGPYLVHLNEKGDPKALWQQAKDQLLEELKSWPYEFPLSEDFPKANQRGSVVGKFLINDGSAPTPASSAWVGLAPPGVAGSWQTEMKGYQFWVQTDREGKFVINNVRAGKYNLFAHAPGFIGDYKSTTEIEIIPGKQINLGDQVYTPPRNGPTLWEIGVPDRSAAEFFVPDPSPNLVNPLFLKDQENKYRQYGLWDRYTDLYPKGDLTYTIGVSNYKKDWFFAHVLRKKGNTYLPTTWQVVFPLKEVAPNGNHTLQIALAGANFAEIQVRVNNPNSKPIFSTMMIGRENLIARHGIHGLYRLYSIGVPTTLLKSGQNTIFLTQSRNNDKFRGVMYDYLRLEGPKSPK